MHLTRIAYTGSLLIVGLGLAVTPHAKASLLFNGTNSKVTLDGSYLDAATHSNYTFEVWIKPYSAAGGELFGKMNYWDEWDLTVLADGGLIWEGAWNYSYWGTETAKGSITTGIWQHVCCAVTNGQASFYVNGSLVGAETVQNPIDFLASTNTGAMPPYSFDGRMPIGYADSGTTPDYNFFNGLIYGIKVWSRALSASEVLAIATTGVPLSTNGLYNAVMLNEGSGTTIHDSLTSLTGRVLTAQWSSDSPTFPSGFLTNGLVAYYPFNGNANDASGNGHNGTVYGATLTTNRFGTQNGAYYFTGTSAYITTPLSNTVFGGDFTASVWYNAYDYADGWPTLLEARDSAENYAFNLAIVGETSGASGIGKLIAGSTYASASWGWFIEGGQAIPLNTWSQVLVTKAGTTVTMYWNGQAVTTGLVSHAIPTSGNTLYIGRAQTEDVVGAYVFHGVLDDIRIYNRALSSNEVAELYANEATPLSPPCSPHKATATAKLDSGFVVGATITDPGCGYTNAPAVLIQGGGGSGAAAIAVVSNGVVVKIIITDAGAGYTNTPNIVIGSPPFVPTVSIAVSAVKVTQHVVLGRNYVLESSTDLVTWMATGPQFTAQAETIVNEFEVDVTGRFFRIRQVP